MMEKRNSHISRKIDKLVEDARTFIECGKKAEAIRCMKMRKSLLHQQEIIVSSIDALTRGRGDAAPGIEEICLCDTSALEANKSELASSSTPQNMKTSDLVGWASRRDGRAVLGDSVDESFDVEPDAGLYPIDEIKSIDEALLEKEDDELLAELEAIEMADELKPVKTPAHADLPLGVPPADSAPSTKAASIDEEDAELAKLEAEMGMQ